MDAPSHQKPTANKPGDWECPTCVFVNFMTRTECMKCRTSKPSNPNLTEAEGAMTPELQPRPQGPLLLPGSAVRFEAAAVGLKVKEEGTFRLAR
eukprot:gene37475-25350_t